MKTAIVFLTTIPQGNTLQFRTEVSKHFDTFIVADTTEDLGLSSKIIQISDKTCVDNGYVGCNISGNETHIKKQVIAYDKFLYVFCEKLTEYDFVWVFEEDVFIPSTDTILNLHKNYCQYDLVTPNNFLKQDTLPDWHWHHIFDKIEPPYYYSMVCAMGISRVMLNKIKEYVGNKHHLFHIEAMFNTIAMQNNLFVIDPLEFKSIVWQGAWGLDEFLLLPNNVFHPVKDIENHPKLRGEIQDYMFRSDYQPKNKLPNFINELL